MGNSYSGDLFRTQSHRPGSLLLLTKGMAAQRGQVMHLKSHSRLLAELGHGFQEQGRENELGGVCGRHASPEKAKGGSAGNLGRCRSSISVQAMG